MHWNFIFYTYK